MTENADRSDLVAELSRQLFFRGLADEHVQYLAACSSRVTFTPGQHLCREGEPADSFYVISQGLVALELSKPGQGDFAVESLQAGDILGWSWLVPPYTWRFKARAIDTTQTIALDGRCLRLKCEQNHELGYQILARLVQVMTQRLETTRHQLIANTRVQL